MDSSKIEMLWTKLHALAEPAFREVQTAALLAQQLREYGYSVQEKVGGQQMLEVPGSGRAEPASWYAGEPTGVVGVLDSGQPGPVAALRADMDALTFRQADGSEKIIHACGHDAHMAMVLMAAERLAAEGIDGGKVKIIFQPAEEIGKGALSLISAGVLDDVDYLFGQHLMSRELAEFGQMVASVRWTACTLMSAVITGVPAHGSKPHLGVNAIDAGVAVVNAINAVHPDPLLGGSVKTTRFQAGGSLNAICDRAELGFDLRSTSNSEMLNLRQRVINVVTDTSEAYGAVATAAIEGSCPAAEIDPEMLELAQSAIEKELGAGSALPTAATTVGEDFNFYAMLRPKIKTAFLGLGCGMEYGLHDPRMSFRHEAMVYGSRVLYQMVQRVLQTRE